MQIPGYRIVRKIDQGGMSTVYLAIQLSVGREVALKVMSPALNADPVFSKRFQREANIVGQLSHPNIVSIYDIGCYKNLNYIAMDYLPGGTIHDRMKSTLPVPEILRIIKEVARALDVAHAKGYVHRDIKPENVLFREDNTAVLSDFGVAKAISTASQTTNAGLVVGTPHYMSPEQSRGMAIDGRSDIYSLGVVFFEMLTGSVPFKADEAVAIAIKHVTQPIPTLPPQYSIYQSILNRFIAKKPNERFQTGQEIITAIEQVEDTLSGSNKRRNSMTDPDSMNVMALFKALVLTSYAVLKVKAENLLEKMWGWRWTPKRGFYHHPRTKVTEIKTNVHSGEDQRITIISTRIRNAAHYQSLPSRKLSLITRAFMFLFVCVIIWSAVAVGLIRFGIVDRNDSNGFSTFVLSTAGVIENYFGNYADRNDNATETEVTEATVEPIASPPNLYDIPETTTYSEANNSEYIEEADIEDIGTLEPLIEEEQIVEPAKVYYALQILPTPEQASVRILNIREKYRDNIRLEPGRYRIEVSHPGYHTVTRWLQIVDQNLHEKIELQTLYSNGDSIVHTLQDGSVGPEMIVLPTGRFTMGDKSNSLTSPEHDVEISQRIAAAKYEVTFAAYDKFAQATMRELPDDKKWGRGGRPVINVSWNDANAYAQWLSQQTGQHYRLPSESEWEFFARADTNATYWWQGDDAEGKANCRRGCKSEFTGVFSSKSAPVGNYAPNAFGLYDTAGNVAEWTADCFQNHFIGATVDGTALTLQNCSLRSVKGGSMKSNAQEISSAAREGLNADTRDETLGFRLVLELEQ